MRPSFDDRLNEVARLAEETAREVLSDDYAALAARAAATLIEIAPDRLGRGKPESWACGILYALGRVNFLSDPGSGEVSMTLKELCTLCGVSEATGSNKGREVRELLGVDRLNARWMLPSTVDHNPALWTISAGGFFLDARTFDGDSRDVLASAGLIPYGPTVAGPVELPRGTRVLLERIDGPGSFRALLADAPPRSAKAKEAAERGDIATLRVEIVGTEPLVWRRLEVPLELMLDDVHLVFQRAFAWENYHLYAFQTKTATYTGFEDGARDLAASDHALADLVARKGSRFTYLYDFGDGWKHAVKVERIGPPEPGAEYPRCTDGERAGPPEDSGGPWGYGDLCEILADPSHPEHAERAEWVEEDFDPEHFDLAATDRGLRR